MRRIVVTCALVFGLLAVTAAPATAWGTRTTSSTSSSSSSTQTVSTPREISVLKYVSDRVALTKIPLSPFMKSFFNSMLKAIGPSLCPILGALAAPEFKSFAIQFCQQIFLSPDPLGAALQALPILCSPGLGELVFPKFASVLPILCGLLL